LSTWSPDSLNFYDVYHHRGVPFKIAYIIHALFLFQESCKCSCLLAKTIPDQFYYQAESLVKPLLLSIAHQHSKVRLAVLEVGCNFTAIYVGCCVDVLFKT
jgi:hypothetical protein